MPTLTFREARQKAYEMIRHEATSERQARKAADKAAKAYRKGKTTVFALSSHTGMLASQAAGALQRRYDEGLPPASLGEKLLAESERVDEIKRERNEEKRAHYGHKDLKIALEGARTLSTDSPVFDMYKAAWGITLRMEDIRKGVRFLDNHPDRDYVEVEGEGYTVKMYRSVEDGTPNP